MKNFTNNFKQFTSRLSARWLIMALMMLVGTSSAWGATEYTIYYVNTDSWSTVKCYAWNNSNNVNEAAWPGNDMAKTGEKCLSYDVYLYEGTKSSSNKCIFNNGSGAQTGDLDINNGKYYYNGGWYSSISEIEEAATLPFLMGTLTDWDKGVKMTLSSSSNVYTCTVNLTSSSTNYEFKIKYQGKWYGNNGEITASISGWDFVENVNNCRLKANKDGDYTFTFNTSDKKVSVTFPPDCIAEKDVTPGEVNVKPANDKYCAGEDYQLSINPTAIGGYTTTIQWQKKDGNNYSDVSTNTSLNLEGLAAGTYTYRATVTWTKGACTVTESTADKSFTVNALPGAPTLSPNTDEVCSGKEFTLPGDYNWYEISTGGTKLNSATISGGITSNKSYWAEAKNASGCVSSTRTEYTLTVNDKPAVPTLSADKTSLIGDEKAVFTVGNTVAGLTYTLYNGENAGESQTSTGRDLTFIAGGAGSYTVKVTNSCGTSTSSPIEITVCTPQTNEFRHANSSYTQLQDQPTYYPGDKAYFVSTIDCCLTGTWSANVQKGEEGWWADLTGSTPKFSMTLTRAGNFTITNMANNGCTQDKNVLVNLDFTVTALSEVTNANGTASGADIELTWNKSANHGTVMIVRYPISGTETIPAGGQAYTEGNTLGGGTVVYVGTAESCTDKNLPAGASYKYYFYTVNNNYYSEGVVLNMSSCPTPAKPQLESTAVTTCNGNVTTFGSITITNIADYDNTYTFKLGDRTASPDANGKIVISSAANTEYTVTVTNSCGNSNSADVEIAINNITPTISGETFTQPEKQIELTVPDGINARWSVEPEADLTVTEGNSTMFSAETNGIYTIKATNGTCSATHEVTVADAFYIYFRNAKKGETAYANFYHSDQNTEEYRGGAMYYAESTVLPTSGTVANFNQGGKEADIITTDCDGYTWYGFKASADVISGSKYFYVHAKNDINKAGWYTHTVPTKVNLTGDVYYTLCETNVNNCNEGSNGWKIVSADAPYAGPKVHASGSTALGTNKFAALYVTDCSGKEITGYQWYKDGQPYSSVCSYVGKKGSEDSNAGETNNIRPTVAGNYSCTVTYEDRTTATSAAVEISGSYNRSFTSNIPVLVVNTGSKGFPDCTGLSGQTASKNASTFKAKRSVDVKIYEGETLVYDRKARMNYRGSSSLNFVKKSYAFCPGEADCVEDKGRQDYVKTAKLNMLGLGEAYDKDWVLYAAAADPSLMRNRLVFDSYAAMTGEWGVQSRYVELIVDGVYKGVYVFMDKITMNEKRVKVDKKTGFIVKFDKTDKEDRIGGYEGKIGDEKTFKTSYTGKDDIDTYDTSIDQRFEIEYPEKDDYTTGWKARVDGIQGMFQAFEDALKQGDYATVQKYIDYTSWADWFIINEFTKNVDAYRASCIFVYTGEAGAKIEARPLWDQELSFNNQASKGTSDKGSNSTTGLLIQHSNVYSDSFKAPFWFTGGSSDIKGGLLSDPCFVQVVKERWNMHQFDALSKKSLEDLVDEYEDELAPEGTTDNALKREIAFWDGKSRGKCDCSYETGNATATGYQNKTFEESKGTITNWIADGAGGRREGLTTAINGLTGASFSIQIIPSDAYTTPWEPVEIEVSVTPAGYDYKLEYTDNDLGSVANTIIKEEGDKITYRIPRPSAWGTGDAEEGERTDIEYGIKATLSVQDGTTVCGTQAAPSSTGKIILQDEDNDNCK